MIEALPANESRLLRAAGRARAIATNVANSEG